MSHFEKRVQLNKIIESQLPEFLVADFPKAVEFFKQYFINNESPIMVGCIGENSTSDCPNFTTIETKLRKE